GVARAFVDQFRDDDGTGLAAELAFRFLFALFPFGIFLAALAAFVAGWVGNGDPSGAVLRGLGDNLPQGVTASIRPELSHVLGNTRPGLLSIGAIGAVWAATSGTAALIKTMNRAYDVEETRPAWVRYGLAVALTVFAGGVLVASFVTLVGGALLVDQLVTRLGVPAGISRTVTLLRWPAVFLLLVGAVAVVIRNGPNVRPPWRLAFAGGAVFAVAWIIATWAFGLYVASFSTYDATYGTLAGFAVVMLWFYLTALVLVAAAELTAVLTKRLAPDVLAERRRVTRAELAVAGAARAAGRTAAAAADGAEAVVDGVADAAGSDEEDAARGQPAGRPPAGARPAPLRDRG
ncbi:MAG TPA: YihY/virulence factor BrkB family protein, partial [Candidatus Limnocylindrales bacterium]